MAISLLHRKLLRDILAMKGQAVAIAMVVAAVWLGENISRTQVLGAALILSGIGLTRMAGRRQPANVQ